MSRDSSVSMNYTFKLAELELMIFRLLSISDQQRVNPYEVTP